MRVRTLLLTLSLLAVTLAGCADQATDESAADDRGPDDGNETSAMCLEGAPDCDDTPTMETIEVPGEVGT